MSLAALWGQAGPTLVAQSDSFSVSSGSNTISQMAFSNQYDLIFVRDGTQDIRVFNVATKSEISIEDARYAFTDFALSPSGRYLYAADYGGTNIGYGTPSNPSYVDRFDMVTDTWSVAKAPAIAYQIKVVDDSHVLLQQEDQWINITLNTYNPGSMTQLASVGTFYEGLYAI